MLRFVILVKGIANISTHALVILIGMSDLIEDFLSSNDDISFLILVILVDWTKKSLLTWQLS